MGRGVRTGSNVHWVQGGLNQRGYRPGVDELLDGRCFFYIWYMAVKEFYGEKIVDKHCHKDEQVYWDKFSSIHNTWFKFSGLVPQAVGNYASRWAFFVSGLEQVSIFLWGKWGGWCVHGVGRVVTGH